MADVQLSNAKHDLISVAEEGTGLALTLDPRASLTIIEISVGVWSGDAPSRSTGQYPITFVGTTDPTDETNGITTPANINAFDTWAGWKM